MLDRAIAPDWRQVPVRRRETMLTLSLGSSTRAGTGSAGSERGEQPRSAHSFHAIIRARPRMGDALVALLREAPAFACADCHVFLIGRSRADSDRIHLTEGWTSEAAHRRFAESADAKAYAARVAALVEGEPDYLDEVPVGGKAVV